MVVAARQDLRLPPSPGKVTLRQSLAVENSDSKAPSLGKNEKTVESPSVLRMHLLRSLLRDGIPAVRLSKARIP